MNDIQNTGSDNRQGHVKFNRIYCAVTGKMIEGDYVKIKRKHVLNESHSTHFDGLFKTKAYRVTTVSYLWDIYSVSQEAYKKLNRKRILFMMFIPFCLIVTCCCLYDKYVGIDSVGAFLAALFMSLFPVGLYVRITEYILKPKLLDKGLINAMVPESDEIIYMDEY